LSKEYHKVWNRSLCVPSNDCVDPYRLGGLLPCLDAGRLLGLLAGREAGLEAGLLDGRLPPVKHCSIRLIVNCLRYFINKYFWILIQNLTGRHGRSIRRAGFSSRYLEGTFVVAKAVWSAGAQG